MNWGRGERCTDEVLYENVGDCPAAAVALEHHHLVRFPSVHVAVDDI